MLPPWPGPAIKLYWIPNVPLSLKLIETKTGFAPWPPLTTMSSKRKDALAMPPEPMLEVGGPGGEIPALAKLPLIEKPSCPPGPAEAEPVDVCPNTPVSVPLT
jgi:hypothetical protein